MKFLRFALLLALGAVFFATPSSAWMYIDVTASEVLSVDPPRVRTTFVVSSTGYGPGCSGQFFDVTPLDPATLDIIDCSPPPAWTCGPATPAADGGVYFNSQGGTDRTFSIVTNRAEPCVRIVFPDPVLGRAPSPTLAYDCVLEACLIVDAPLPTRPSSWGGVKSVYR